MKNVDICLWRPAYNFRSFKENTFQSMTVGQVIGLLETLVHQDMEMNVHHFALDLDIIDNCDGRTDAEIWLPRLHQITGKGTLKLHVEISLTGTEWDKLTGALTYSSILSLLSTRKKNMDLDTRHTVKKEADKVTMCIDDYNWQATIAEIRNMEEQRSREYDEEYNREKRHLEMKQTRIALLTWLLEEANA